MKTIQMHCQHLITTVKSTLAYNYLYQYLLKLSKQTGLIIVNKEFSDAAVRNLSDL